LCPAFGTYRRLSVGLSQTEFDLGTVKMCEDLSNLRGALASFVARVDIRLLSSADATRVMSDATAMEAMAGTLKALAASRVAEGDGWKKRGHRSPAEALARDTGTSLGNAKEILEVGRRLGSQPEVDAAARRGDLSFAQVSMISNAAEADPSAERRLLDEAERSSLSGLKDECARTKAQAHLDLEELRRSIRSRRSLRSWTDLEGVWRLSASGNPEDGAQIMAALSPIADGLFDEARIEGRRDPPAAYAFDALVQLARESTSEVRLTRSPEVGNPGRGSRSAEQSGTNREKKIRRGAQVKLLVRVDYDTLLRGAPARGEVCELVGYGPISVSAVNDLLEIGDPFVGAVLTKAKALVGVAHLGRRPTAHQQSALEWLYPSCAARGCPSQARLERDHRIDWSKTHFTMFDLLDLLCSHHHDLKSRDGWALVDGSGKRPFVPPDDPRHPVKRRVRASNPSTGPPKPAA
jgi:hypothetical protein